MIGRSRKCGHVLRHQGPLWPRKVADQERHSDNLMRGRFQRDFRLPFLFQLMGWSARDAVGSAVAVLAGPTILVNVLFLQPGLHPAPIFKPADATVKTAPIPDTKSATAAT